MIFLSKLLVEGPIAQIWCWKLLSTVFSSSTVTLFLVGNETSARSKWTKCVREGRRQEIHDNASRNLNEIMSRTFPLISCIYIRFKNVLAGKWVLLRIHSVGNINECVLQEYDGRATWWIMRSPTVQSYVDGGVSTKETISAFYLLWGFMASPSWYQASWWSTLSLAS